MSKIILIAAAILLAASGLTNCGHSDTSSDPISLNIKGSDTMVHLASNWAENYMTLHKDVDLAVTGGGSGTGLAALLNGTTDICIASRKIKSKEMDLAASKNIHPVETVVARDGISVIVNPANPVSRLTVDQTGRIFTGEITNWSEVGGPNHSIQILSRESSSGTFVFFQERVLNEKDYSSRAMLLPSNSAIIQSIEQDKWSIGYVGLGYALNAGDKIRVLKVADTPGSTYVTPSVETVQSGQYAIARPLHFYTNGLPAGAAGEFVKFCLSAAGQKVVFETGFVPLQ